MNVLFDLWPVYAPVLAAMAVNAVLALAGLATLMAGRLSFVAAACAVAGGAAMALPLALPWLLAASGAAGLALALGFGGLAARLPSGQAALASLALALLAGALAARWPVVTARAAPPWVALLVVVLAAAGLRALLHSWHGRVARLLRHDAALAAGSGVVAWRVELIGFAVAGVAGGLAGGLLALGPQGAVASPFAALHLGFLLAAAVLIGGCGHWSGAVLGAGLVTLLPLAVARLAHGSEPGGLGDLAIGLVLLAGWWLLPGGLTEADAEAARRRLLPRRRHPARAHYHRVDR